MAAPCPAVPLSPSELEEARAQLNALALTLEQGVRELASARAHLAKDVSEGEARKTQLSTAPNGSVVTLNIGGTIFATAKDNLLREKGSMLETMLTSPTVTPAKDGSYFIDRDPTNFRHILNYLRGGTPYLPAPGREFEELYSDAEFYNIASYKQALSQHANATTTSPACESSTVDSALMTALPSSSISTPATTAEEKGVATKDVAGLAVAADDSTTPASSAAPIVASLGNVREFPFSTFAASNGIIDWIGTDGGTKAFVNPIASGKILVECPEGLKFFGPSEFLTEKGKPTSLWNVTPLPSGGGVCNSSKPSINNLWISMKLPFAVQLTAFTAMRAFGCSVTMKNWELAGSNDGKTWTVIFTKEGDGTHDHPDGVFKLEKVKDAKQQDEKTDEPGFYTHLRWRNVSGMHQQRYHCVHFYAMELYGRILL